MITNESIIYESLFSSISKLELHKCVEIEFDAYLKIERSKNKRATK